MKIDHFRDTPHLPLGESSAVGVPLGEPVSQVATTSVERDDGVEAGVWECTPAAGGARSCNRSSAISSRGAAPSPRMAVRSFISRPATH